MAPQELAGNQIAELDNHVLASLRHVRDLDLSGNALAALGAGLAAMPALALLALEHNRLDALPESLGACAALVRLDVSHNQLRALPARPRGLADFLEFFWHTLVWRRLHALHVPTLDPCC